MSNALLDTDWQKVSLGKQLLSRIIERENVEIESIFEILNNQEVARDERLPDTGVSKEWERALSPMFIEMEHYATRCSSVILWDYSDNITFAERTYGLELSNTVVFELN